MLKKSRYNYIKGHFGKPMESKLTYEEYAAISHYDLNTQNPDQFRVDDTTWNDLDLDSVFLLINHTYSAVGRDYLYHLLRHPVSDERELAERERLITFFDEHQEERTHLQQIFDEIGFTRKISVSDHMERLFSLKKAGNMIHFSAIFLILFSVLFMIFVDPVWGIIMLLCACGFSIVSYYRIKNSIDSFFTCIRQLVNMLVASKRISDMKLEALSEYTQRLDRAYKTFGNVRRGAWLLTGKNEHGGSLADIFMEYIRMFTHIDLIKFNSMLGNIGGHKEDVFELMDTLGYLEAMISIASFRHVLPYYCLPEFEEKASGGMLLNNGYHILIEKPVANSIQEDRPVLITGSNASGKSTFLKSVAISAILAQTIHTVPADVYRAPFYRIYSSMALSDHLDSGESYYIVEIKSLKRIIDAVNAPGARVLCFIDEVLRGTNTVERIAASSEILRDLASHNAMCFAATHDIELTQMLENYYSDYHFTEEFTDRNIVFPYVIQKGRATSKNAIRLLEVMGYEEAVIRQSQETADEFTRTGTWRVCP